MKDTKDKIITGTVFCLNENEKASIDEIATHLGLNRRTIHRYFKDRDTLMQECLQQMMAKCNQSMSDAYESTTDPLQKVEAMFFAALSIGREYSFVKKLFHRSSYNQAVEKERLGYESVKEKWFILIIRLQEAGVISGEIPLPWIYNLFGGMIDIAIHAQGSGDIALNEVKNLSWTSFKGSIGII